MKQKNPFRTRDLALSASINLFLPLIGIEKSDTNRVTFLFDHSSAAEKLIRGFWSGSLAVEPRAFFEKIRELKARIYAEE